MRKKYTLGEKRGIIIQFIRRNPKTTYREIKKKTCLSVNKEFKNGLKEAFEEAGVKPPRTFDIKTKEEKRKIIIDYIKKHPKAGGHIVRKDTKINFSTIFKTLNEAYEIAKIHYPRKIDKRTREEKKKEIIKAIKENPLITIQEIMGKLNTNPYKFFKNMNEIYKEARIKKIRGHDKRLIKTQFKIISFIKRNPLSTQREINKNCKTHVQTIFNKGIFEAYEKARIKFPYERLKLYGIGIKEIRDRAKTFEDEISIKLSGYGKVNRLVKTKRGFADIIFERKDKKVVIEIKDYQNKDISISQIKQLNKYLEDLDCNLGLLICHNKPKKDRFLIGKNRIFLLDKYELNKIPKLIDGCIV